MKEIFCEFLGGEPAIGLCFWSFVDLFWQFGKEAKNHRFVGKCSTLRLFGMCTGRVGMCIERVRPKYPADVSGLWQFTVRRPGAQTRLERTRQGLKPNWPLAATTPLRRTKFRFSESCKKGQALWVKAGRLESTVLSLTRYLLFWMYLWAGDVSSNVFWYFAAS